MLNDKLLLSKRLILML